MTPPLPHELDQVLKGLALNREPGWNFPGNFLALSFDEVADGCARVSIEPGPHCVDATGAASLGALAVLADIGLAASMRRTVGLDTRMATVSMALQLTGVPLVGRLESRGRFDGFVAGAAARQGLTRSEIHAGGALAATASGRFVALEDRNGTAPLPLRRRGEGARPLPLRVEELTAEEQAVFERARAALEGGEGAFIDRFWGLLPERREEGAVCDFGNGLHVGNRVGHTQGGVTFALAAATGATAVGDDWKLVGMSAWYVRPGTGPVLRAEATVLHRGALSAVVRSRVSDPEGRTVLEAVTSHARGG